MDKVIVGEVPEPRKGVWREITRILETQKACAGWFYHIVNTGLSDAEIRTRDKGFQVWARRK